MSTYLLHIHENTHTCPADGQPHPFDIRRTVLAVTGGGPCHTPVTIRLADTTTVIDCGRRYPAERQCDACRTTITVQHTTRRHHGHTPTHVTPAPTGHAPRPCDVCRQPLAAVLAPTGHHVLCHPPARPHPTRTTA